MTSENFPTIGGQRFYSAKEARISDISGNVARLRIRNGIHCSDDLLNT